jgi:hypothetical protein
MPDLQTFLGTHAKGGFILRGVNGEEEKESVVQFVDMVHLSFPIWLYPDERILRSRNSFSLPYSIVLDLGEIVRYPWSGTTCLSALVRIISPMLRQ